MLKLVLEIKKQEIRFMNLRCARCIFCYSDRSNSKLSKVRGVPPIHNIPVTILNFFRVMTVGSFLVNILENCRDFL